MKKWLTLLLAVLMILGTMSAAMAVEVPGYMNYYNQLDDAEPILEWMEEAHAHAVDGALKFFVNDRSNYMPNPTLDDYPTETALIYRTAGYYGGRAAVRNNTAVLVFADQAFQTKEAGYAYLESLGLIDIIDSLEGSIVLVTPADAAAGFGAADLANYYILHDAMFNQRTRATVDGVTYYYAESEYFGAYSKVYMIGIDGGATFINNYVAPGRFDCIGRVSGLLLVGGEMAEDVTVSNYLPVYLLNGGDVAEAAYRAVNDTNAYTVENGRSTYYNTDAPLRCVMAKADEAPALDAYVAEAFDDLFLNAQRVDVISSYNQVAGYEMPYTDYVDVPAIARFALVNRNAIIDGVTKDGGLHILFNQSEDYSAYKTRYDQYLQSWYEILPESVLDNTAPAGSVPVIMALHGAGDDPLMYVDEIGVLEVAGREGVAVIAPFQEDLMIVHEQPRRAGGAIYEGVTAKVMPMLLDDVLAKYPALDASRVYVTGYSLGGGATYRLTYGGMEKIAGVAPMAGMHMDLVYHSTPEEEAALNAIRMPAIVMTSTYDVGFTQAEGHINDAAKMSFEIYAKANDFDLQPYDFEKYPMIGQDFDRLDVTTIAGEWRTFLWTETIDGMPMLAFSCTENLKHSLYSGYADIAWNFLKHFSRDLETGAVIYTADVK